MDKLQKVYEEMLNENKKKVEKENPSILDKMNERISVLEEEIKKLKGE